MRFTRLYPQFPATPSGPRDQQHHLHLGGSWNIKNLGPTPDPSNQTLRVSESPRGMVCTFRRKSTCRRRGQSQQMRTVWEAPLQGGPQHAHCSGTPARHRSGTRVSDLQDGGSAALVSWDERRWVSARARLITVPSTSEALSGRYLVSPRENLRDALVTAFSTMTPVFTPEGEEDKGRVSQSSAETRSSLSLGGYQRDLCKVHSTWLNGHFAKDSGLWQK